MNAKKLRDIIFPLHRYLGLLVGLILIVVGLTGSLLVFQHEIDQWMIQQQFGEVIPQEERVPMEVAVNNVKTAYEERPELKISGVNTSPKNSSYIFQLQAPNKKRTQVFVDPYTGKILGSRQRESGIIDLTFKLHYQLLAGETGRIIVGISALFMVILSITGVALWSGWRKLISGFKIKWNAHPKRVNYDIHKVAGIVTAVFLGVIAFTGFCWNFYDFAKPAIYAVTFSPKPPEPVSVPIAVQVPIEIGEILQRAETALPGAETTYISFPTEPEEAFTFYKKQPQETTDFGNSAVYLDQYSGEILYVQDGLKPSLGDRIFNSFSPLHYGTFGGLPTRIFYLFVGLAPLILSVTGFVMWWYRKRKNMQQSEAIVANSGGRG